MSEYKNYGAPGDFVVTDMRNGEDRKNKNDEDLVINAIGEILCNWDKDSETYEELSRFWVARPLIGKLDSKKNKIYAGDVVEFADTTYPIGQIDTKGKKCLRIAVGIVSYDMDNACYYVDCLIEGLQEWKKQYGDSQVFINFQNAEWDELTKVGNAYLAEFKEVIG